MTLNSHQKNQIERAKEGKSDDTQHLIDVGIEQKIKSHDKSATEEKHYASSSPMVKPHLNRIRRSIIETLKEWDRCYTTDEDGHYPEGFKAPQGSFVHLKQLLETFKRFEPLFMEMDQPDLAYEIIAQQLTCVVLDHVLLSDKIRTRTLTLKNKIVELLEIEWWRRQGIEESTHMEIYLRVFNQHGTAAHRSLTKRSELVQNGVNKLLDSHGAERLQLPPRSTLDRSALALIAIMADENMWDKKEPLLHVEDGKKGEVEFTESTTDLKGLKTQLSESLQEKVLGLPDWLIHHYSASLPLTQPCEPWRASGVPDCHNYTGGFHDEDLRKRRRLGHGRHRDYFSVSSKESLEALNIAQHTRYSLDLEMAAFVDELIDNSDKLGETFPGIPPKPKFSADDLKDATGNAALLPQVKNREWVIETYPDKDARNSEEVNREIKEHTGKTWEEIRTDMRLLYDQLEHQKAAFQKSISIKSRLNEFRNERYNDGFSWVFGVDYRGRIYEKSDLLSPQDSNVERHCLRFTNGEMLDEDGLYYLKIAIGAAKGGTKISDKERFEIGDKLIVKLTEMGSDLYGNRWEFFNKDVDEPWLLAQLAAGCHRYFNLGQPFDVPCPLDATQSAVQFWAALTNDVEAMKFCNLMPATEEDRPFDAYAEVHDVIEEAIKDLGDKAWIYKDKNGNEKTATKAEQLRIRELMVVRDGLKNGLMTKLYGSAVGTRQKSLFEILKLEDKERHLATIAGRFHEHAMKIKFGPLFEAKNLIKRLVYDSLVAKRKRQMDLPELVQFYDENMTPIDPELTPEQFRERRKNIDILRKLKADPSSNAQEIGDLEKLLKEEEWEFTKDKLKSRIKDQVATAWRRDNLCKRSHEAFEKRKHQHAEVTAKIAYKADLKLSWTTPDGFLVGLVEPYESEAKQVKAGLLPALYMKCPVEDTRDLNRMVRATAPGFVHSLDANLLRSIIKRMNCDIMLIHDCAAVSVMRHKELKKVIAEEFCNIIGEDGRLVLRNFIIELLVEDPANPTDDDQQTMDFVHDTVFKMFPPMPEGVNLRDCVKDARYAWN